MSHERIPTDLLSTQSAFVCDLVPRLLALAEDPRANHPVVLLSGRSGSGHSHALETAQQCARYVPNVLVTFKKDGAADTSDSANPLELLHLLAVMVSKLRSRYLRFGSISFLRFQLCYDILTANINLDTDPDAHTTVRGRIRQRVFGRIPQPSTETIDAVDKFATVASIRPPGLLGGMVWAFTMLKWPLWWVTAWRMHRLFRDMSTFTTGDDTTQCLVSMWTWLHSKRQRPDTKRAERALCEAFLADLGSFHRWHPRRSSCLVLLDDIPNPLRSGANHPATRLLRHITALRAEQESLHERSTRPGYGGDNRVPAHRRSRTPGCASLTIVAVTDRIDGDSRPTLRQADPPVAPVPQALTAWQSWFPGNHALAKSWYCHAYFPPLSVEDVRLLNPSPPTLSDAAVEWLLGFGSSRPYVIHSLIAALEKLDEPVRAELMSANPSRRSAALFCRELPADIHQPVHAELSRRV